MDQVQKKEAININGVFNPSMVCLSQGEQSVLSQGLKFAPPRTLNKFETFIDAHKCIRKNNIKRHFILNPIGNGSQITSSSGVQSVEQDFLPTSGISCATEAPVPTRHTNFSNTSLFNPPGFFAPSIQTFKEMVL